MTDCLAGNGYLLQANRLVTPVRYRLRWATGETGRSAAEGELRGRPGAWRPGAGPARFLMHTDAGFSVPLELTAPSRGPWLPFRRIPWEAVDQGEKEDSASRARAGQKAPKGSAWGQDAARQRRVEGPAIEEDAMERTTHFADAATLQMALATGMVALSGPKWDPHSGDWVIRARSRQGGEDWVLTQGNGPAYFSERQKAWEATRSLQMGGLPYLIGRR